MERVNEVVKQQIALIIERELNDPRLKNTIIDITRVKTTPDLKYAKVYVSIMGDETTRSEILKVLEKAKGFMRKSIALILTARTAPELVFVLDDSIDNYMHIEKILKEINNE